MEKKEREHSFTPDIDEEFKESRGAHVLVLREQRPLGVKVTYAIRNAMGMNGYSRYLKVQVRPSDSTCIIFETSAQDMEHVFTNILYQGKIPTKTNMNNAVRALAKVTSSNSKPMTCITNEFEEEGIDAYAFDVGEMMMNMIAEGKKGPGTREEIATMARASLLPKRGINAR